MAIAGVSLQLGSYWVLNPNVASNRVKQSTEDIMEQDGYKDGKSLDLLQAVI